jgi:hypothetical protein
MAVVIAGRRFWLWRAVGDEGDVSICWCNAGAPRFILLDDRALEVGERQLSSQGSVRLTKANCRVFPEVVLAVSQLWTILASDSRSGWRASPARRENARSPNGVVTT